MTLRLLLFFCCLSGFAHADNRPAKIAIIIDDVGYHFAQGERFTQLPGPITLAVLPYSPHGPRLAQMGHERGKEIMLHAPMSTLHRTPVDTGGLNEYMRQTHFRKTLRENLQAVPHISGVNNHMGSYLTQLRTPMSWVMEEISQQGLFFVDSRTTPDSVAHEVAVASGVPSMTRDIFLDNLRDPEAIHRQFQKLLLKARRRGHAVAIGHPYKETLNYLQQALANLPTDIEIISVRQMMALTQPRRDRAPSRVRMRRIR